MMWCNYLSEKTRSRACALIDKSPVVHLDWMLAKVNEQFFSSLQAVRAAYGKYFSHKKTLTCMHQTSGQSPVGHVAWQRNDTGASRETKMPDQHKDVPPPQTVKVNKNSTKTAKMDQERQTPATPKQGILRREVVHPQEANPTRKVAARVMLQNPGSENLHEELPQLTVTRAARVAKPLAALHDATRTISDKASLHRANVTDSSLLLALRGTATQKATAKSSLATKRSSSKASLAMQVQVTALKEELASERAKELSDMHAQIKELEGKMAKDHQENQAVIQEQQKKIKDYEAQVDKENRFDRMDELKASLDAERQDGFHLREKIENLEAQLRDAFETVANLQKANQAARPS